MLVSQVSLASYVPASSRVSPTRFWLCHQPTFVGFCDTLSVSPLSSPRGSVWCLSCAAVAAAGNQRRKPVGLENISAAVLLLSPGVLESRFLGSWFGVLTRTLCPPNDSRQPNFPVAGRPGPGTASTHLILCLHLEIYRKSRVWHGEGTRQGLHVWDWREANSSLVFFSSSEPSVCSPFQAVAEPCGFGTAHQYPHLRSQRVILWCAVK